jgi:hypothetical protein
VIRAKELSPVRIARAVSAILLLSILQVVGAPILAPQLTTPIASAADANDLPTGLGTVYQFLAESYTSGSTTWPEASGGEAATISATALKVTNTAGTLGANKSVVAVQGSFQTSITFPATVAYGNATNPNDYTFFHVARYAPQQSGLTNANYCDTSANHVTNNSAKKNRIFSSTANNWLSGFWACSAGVAYHMGWLTQSTSAVSELSGNSGNNWLLSADCGYVASSTSGCNGRYRAFGTDRTTTPSTSVVGHRVIVNGGQFPLEVSDFQIAEVISYPTILSIADIVKVETYLARKYGITLSSTAATKLGIHRASVGTTLNEPLRVQPQVAIQDSNGQTVTTDNSTLITATVTGVNGRIIGTATADAVQGIATFDNFGLDGVPGNSYTITYSSNAGLASTSESRVFSRGGGSETDTALTLNATAGLNQYAEVADYTGSPVDITGDVTLEAWVFPTSSCTSDQAVISKFNSYMLYCGGGVWKYVFDSDGLNWFGSSSTIAVRSNEWQHVAYVKSGTTLTIYIDGQAVATFAGQSASLTANNGAFSIGRYGSSNYFQGRIDEVRIYNAARSQAQVQSDMHNYGTITESNLRAYFDFNEGTGTTLFNRDAGAVASDDLTLYNITSQNWIPIPTTSTSQAYTVVTFARSVLTSSGGWKVPSGVSRVRALVVAGGGGGGSDEGGGGGGGGFIDTTSVTLVPNSTASVVVGYGGIGAEGNDLYNASNGQNSTFANLQAIGGGAGGSSINTDTAAIRNGKVGGSGGGGAGESLSNRSGGAGTAGQGFSGGNGTNGGRGGGGGGAGEAGNTDLAGEGGDGRVSDNSGSSVTYAGGGGGGNGNTSSTSYAGGDGGGGRGGSSNVTALRGTAGLGGGGGGGGSLATAASSVAFSGADGGSGIIVIRWITATAPIFTGPSSDTLTAGMVETFTVSGSPISPLTRSYRWQVSSDTGTTWVNATTGTGLTSASYITSTLETTTSGIRYQYRVVVTDSDTAGLSIVETSTAMVFLTINPRITISGSSVSLTQKYGETQTVTYTIANGTGTRTTSASPNNRTGITWSSVSGNAATLAIGAGLSFGTYYETLTVTDSVTASATQMFTISISKADTITVTAASSTTTYNGSAITPAYVVSGLKNSETATATSNFLGISGTSYGTTTTPPTNAGSYRFTPSDVVLSVDASLNNYQGVTYESATVTINKAFQAKLSIGQYDAFPGISSYPINVYGGTGLGNVTRTLVETGTANCTLSGTLILTAANVGTCTVRAVKDGGVNYFNETTTATIYWITFINRYTPSGPTVPTDLGLSGSTGFEKRTYETFTVLSFANGSGSAVTSAAKGSVIRVIGTGFNSSDETTEVIIGFLSIPKSSLTFNTTNPLANYVEFTLPNSSDLDAGANDVAMKSRKGWAFAPGLLNVTG